MDRHAPSDDGWLERSPEAERDAGIPDERPAEGGNAPAEPADPERKPSRELVEELAKIANPRTSWTRNIGTLILTLVVFYSLGFFDSPLEGTLVLIAALLVHETGHLLAMKLFGYRNVQMFFIPFFGAAVSGANVTAAGWKRAMVTLAGPLTGLAFAFAAFVVWLETGSGVAQQTALIFAILNGFNLLPFYPLDGGRFLQEARVARNRYLEAIFRVVLGGLTILAAVALEAWLLAIVGGFVVLATGYAFKISSVARRLKGTPGFPDAVTPEDVSAETILATGDELARAFPQEIPAPARARQMWSVWEQLNARPPGALATGGVLLLYVLVLVAVPVAPAAYSLSGAEGEGEIVAQRQADGSVRKTWRVSVGKMVRSETGVNDAALFHGRHVEYVIGFAMQKELEGAWRDGFPDGTWRAYAFDGGLLVETVFERGAFVVRRDFTPHGVVERKLFELSGVDQVARLEISRRGPYGPANADVYLPVR